MVEVRRLINDDLPACADLWLEKQTIIGQNDRRWQLVPDARAQWLSAAESALSRSDCAWFAAVDDAQVIGFVVAAIQPALPGGLPRELGIITEFVLDAHQPHAGAGRALLGAARGWLAALSAEHIIVRTTRRFAVEQAFWRSLGARDWVEWLWIS